MENITDFFETLYANFNSRKIDLVIANMTENVKWANGMEGGHVLGTDAVKEYWTRQFTIVSANVTPLKIDADKGSAKIKVHQVVHDLNGNLLADEFIYHLFHFDGNKIDVFDIGEKVTA